MTKQTRIEKSQVAVVGDNAHIEGGIHFHSALDRLDNWRKAHPWRFAGALLAALLLLTLTGTALAGAISPDIRQTLFLNGFWPRAFPAEQEGEVLIVIANFYYSDNLTNTEAHNEIRRAIEQARDEVNFANLRVEVAPIRLRAEDRVGAVALAERYNASLLIWGADTGVRVAVNFYNHKQPDFDAAAVQIDETMRTQIAAPSEYATFITQDLPIQLTFLSFFAVGQSYYAAENYPASAHAIEAAVARLSDAQPFEGAADAYFYLGWLYQYPLPDLPQALAAYTRALELDPDYAKVYNNRGITYWGLGEYALALADLTCALELAPDLTEVYSNRGSTYHALGKYDLALADYTRALELAPDLAIAYNNRGLTYRALGEYDLALAAYTRAIELDPDLAEVYIGRGITYWGLGEYALALADFTHALELNPEYAWAYNSRGYTYAALGEYVMALADFTRALELDPDNVLAYNNRGRTYAALGDYAPALADYTRAIELDPTNANIYYFGACVHAALGNLTEACAWLENALSLAPKYHAYARTDPAFDPIRGEPCFQALMDGEP